VLLFSVPPRILNNNAINSLTHTAHTDNDTYTHSHTDTHIQHTLTMTHFSHSLTHTLTHTHSITLTHTHTHTHSLTHTHTHTHTQTHTLLNRAPVEARCPFPCKCACRLGAVPILHHFWSTKRILTMPRSLTIMLM
jgi:hypothetical protein